MVHFAARERLILARTRHLGLTSLLEGEVAMHRRQAMHGGRGISSELQVCCSPPSLALPLKGGGESEGGRT
jgi:hypothetical protein